MWSLRNKTNELRREKGERCKSRNRFLTIKNKLMVTKGEVGWGWVKWVMGIKECTYQEEHRVGYGSVESLSCIPETNVTLYVS